MLRGMGTERPKCVDMLRNGFCRMTACVMIWAGGATS